MRLVRAVFLGDPRADARAVRAVREVLADPGGELRAEPVCIVARVSRQRRKAQQRQTVNQWVHQPHPTPHPLAARVSYQVATSAYAGPTNPSLQSLREHLKS